MHLRVLKIPTLGLLLIAAPLVAQRPPVSDAALRIGNEFATHYPNEIALCITSDEWRLMETEWANYMGLRPGRPCTRDTLAFAHTHPANTHNQNDFLVFFYRATGRKPTRGALDRCYLGRADVAETAKDLIPYVVVFAGDGVWCWWSKEQVRAIDAPEEINWPPPGQVHGGEG